MGAFEDHLHQHQIDFDIDTYRISYDMQKGYCKEGLQVLKITRGPSLVEFEALEKQLEKERVLRISAQLTLAILEDNNLSTLGDVVESVMIAD